VILAPGTFPRPSFLATWGATREEIAAAMAGDELVEPAPMNATRSIDITAPPRAVFPWLVQMGFGRAGWYSYDWIDNLGRTSARSVVPELQNVVSGDPICGGPIDVTAVVVRPPNDDDDGSFVLDYRNRFIQFSLAYQVQARPFGTRLVSRARARITTPGGWIAAHLLELGDGIMVRRQLLNLRERIETARPTSSGGSA